VLLAPAFSCAKSGYSAGGQIAEATCEGAGDGAFRSYDCVEVDIGADWQMIVDLSERQEVAVILMNYYSQLQKVLGHIGLNVQAK
jgi:hypothetical protein